MTEIVLNEDHLAMLTEALRTCRHRLFIATADLKDLHVPPPGRGRARSIVAEFEELTRRGVEVRLLHAGVPSTAFLGELKRNIPDGLEMRRCVRVHTKTIIVDGRWMYVGSANLTGAGLGAKSPRRRNFEAGIRTDDMAMVDRVADALDEVWTGACCRTCGRTEYCPEPLEEPAL